MITAARADLYPLIDEEGGVGVGQARTLGQLTYSTT